MSHLKMWWQDFGDWWADISVVILWLGYPMGCLCLLLRIFRTVQRSQKVKSCIQTIRQYLPSRRCWC
jgi:hypothetical protein